MAVNALWPHVWHNIIQIHNNVMWDWQYSTYYSRIFPNLSLKGEGARVIDKFNIWKFKLEMSWFLWIFRTLRINTRKNYLPMMILKWRNNTKGVVKKQCPSLCWTWRTINLRTLGVAKDKHRHERLFTTSKRRETCQQISSFVANSARAN